MAIRVALHHKTVYEYDRQVTLSPQIVRLRPAPHSRTIVTSYSLRIEPQEHFINWQQDPQGNFLARLVFPGRTRRLSFEVDLVADMAVINPFDFFLEDYAEVYPFCYESSEKRDLAPYLEAAPAGPRLERFLESVDRSESRTIEFLVELNRRLAREIHYVIRVEPGVQTPEETLGLRAGSCRDSGWLLVQILRKLGLAARFVSGYLIQLKADVKPLDGPPGPDEDFTDLHAWAEAYVPGAGWIGMDPTSGLLAGEGHIPLAVAPDPQSAAPVSGKVSPSEVNFHHEMRATRIMETPRITKPYTEEQWKRLCEVADSIDAELDAQDIRLTMGGEPTFVSVNDPLGDEWNTAALGPSKARLASDLLRRLRDRFAPGALLHFGQGKWYPGESLPRWAYACYWRADGLPIWNDQRLIGDPEHDYRFDVDTARQFANRLAERLEVSPSFVIPAYEDPLVYIHRERLLPVNVDPRDNRLEDPEERARLSRIFERGLGRPAGFILPLRRVFGRSVPEWESGTWLLRSPNLFLMPGDSPIGFRLPLEGLPWEPPERIQQQTWTPDPMAPNNALPFSRASVRATDGHSAFRSQPRAQVRMDLSSAALQGVVRTALAVEARQGQLCVFLPPMNTVEDYIDLVAAIEDTAGLLETPVLIEGYSPPFDSRLRHIKVTPDPGVIEVNLHPAANWRELAENTTTLYEEARLSRLGTEKFMVDGRHTGTGGGNHVVLGGVTPADSPFLRRPDLLKSMVGYWLNHPSLSYLFSGMFIGPTSQAPRVDETRPNALYELDIAFELAGRNARQECPPWLVDRIFRDILVDVTGNTHRAEFCIDKLYSPDSASGRLGLVELRSFEMPPHSRMSLAQQLLVRALVAWFWRHPYDDKPIRWGTRLHDLFLLPHFIERDFKEVVADLRMAGYPLELSWFAPHLEFRFPLCGRVCYEGIELELRQAIEIWDVLGEEPGSGGTTRFVDSSVERMQVRVGGLVHERFIIACNGRRLPLRPAGAQGEFISGVRYRAWQPPRCLHPVIPAHTPLVFDVIDIKAGRSIGGCTYHVAHPGGRNYETPAVNSNEAEARRMARFSPFGHTPGLIAVPLPEVNPEFPTTLDLRRRAPEAQ